MNTVPDPAVVLAYDRPLQNMVRFCTLSFDISVLTTEVAQPSPVYVYIYWDHSNIFIEAQNMAHEVDHKEFGDDVAYRVRINFHNLLELAREDRMLVKAVAAGSVPPEMKSVWKSLQAEGVRTEIIDRSEMGGSEKDIPDLHLQREMLLDGMINKPGTIVLLTGDGAGWAYGKVFLPTLQGLKSGGWNVELLSWTNSCNKWLREWVIEKGHFTSLDHFYNSVTFLEPSENKPQQWRGRPSTKLELWRKRASPFARAPQDKD